MYMQAYELLAHLKFLQLTGMEDGEYQWLGSKDEWQDVRNEIQAYEMKALKESESDVNYYSIVNN